MKRVTRLFNKIALISCIEDFAFIGIGILFLLKAAAASEFVVRVFSFIVIISGLFSLIRYILRIVAKKMYVNELWLAVVKIVLGVVGLVSPKLLNNFDAISVGLFLSIMGFYKLYYSFYFYHNEEEIWNLVGVMSVLVIAMGLLLLINPFGELVLMTRVIGAFTICYGLFDIMNWLLLRKRSSVMVKLFK